MCKGNFRPSQRSHRPWISLLEDVCFERIVRIIRSVVCFQIRNDERFYWNLIRGNVGWSHFNSCLQFKVRNATSDSHKVVWYAVHECNYFCLRHVNCTVGQNLNRLENCLSVLVGGGGGQQVITCLILITCWRCYCVGWIKCTVCGVL